MPKAPSAYDQLIERIFFNHYQDITTSFQFDRNELATAAKELQIDLPKNLGDVLYKYRFRAPLPKSIRDTQKEGFEWLIKLAGIGLYRFELATINRIVPRNDLISINVPDATPEIISTYALNDEQALLAILRYNRLIDVFLGLIAYSLQNHLRTSVHDIGQIEIDELYVALDKRGCHYIIPVQAKSGNDQIATVQAIQDISFVKQSFPGIRCRAVAAQFMFDEKIALFELTMQDDEGKGRR